MNGKWESTILFQKIMNDIFPFMCNTFRDMGTDKQLYERAEIQTDALIE
jgi:hypothetical protein